jgi:hypothetical protein
MLCSSPTRKSYCGRATSSMIWRQPFNAPSTGNNMNKQPIREDIIFCRDYLKLPSSASVYVGSTRETYYIQFFYGTRLIGESYFNYDLENIFRGVIPKCR